MPGENMLQSEAFWLVLGALAGVLGAQMLAAHKHRKKEAAHRAALQEEQARARRSERMAEVGAMTGGLAHEIRNPLSTVGLNAALLREMIEDAGMEPDLKHRALKRLDALGRETDRLRDILEDFLQYAGRMNLSATPVDMVELLQELDDFFHPQCDQANVRCELKIPSEPVKVSADASLLKQALLNLMLNAVQVLEGKEGQSPTDPDHPGWVRQDSGPGQWPRDRAGTIGNNLPPLLVKPRGGHRLRTPGDPADCGGPPR